MTDGGFTEGEKALIREISRCCNNNCSAKRFFDDKENEKNLTKTIEIVGEIQAGKKKKLDWMQWFIGGGIGLYAIEKMIGYLNKHH